jgi:uncharacterized membrane protein (UPF0127 family)
VGGQAWRVAVADDPAERSRGLMGVEDLGSLRGMLFVFAEDSTAAFWMKDTPLALDIAFFAADGSLVGRFDMEPCPEGDCLAYRPGGTYRFALEVPAGGFSDVGELRLDPESVGDGR